MRRHNQNFFSSVVQNRITAYWFKNKELALAFGITLAFSRLGSVLNFFLTQSFKDVHGLPWTLWGGNSIFVFPKTFNEQHIELQY